MELNKAQQAAVEYGNGPLLIVAGAGSGKTRTLTARFMRLLERGITPAAIVAITFTNKAALEMRERVEKLKSRSTVEQFNQPRDSRTVTSETNVTQAQRDSSTPFIGTFHSFCAMILRAQAPLLGRTASYTIFDSDDSLSLARKITKGHDWRLEGHSPAKLLHMIGKVKNTLAEPTEELDRRGLQFYEDYERTLREMNGFDFDDLIEKVVRLFREKPDILSFYQDRYTHILVDEYQDVNRAQYEFVRLLASRTRNLSVVGDDAQAIYGWRHADFKNFLSFEKDWPGAHVVLLEENYRSSGTIIRAASTLIAKNAFQKPKDLWTKNPDGAPITIVAAGNPEEEAAYVAETILPLARHVGSPSLAILYRTNAQSRALEQALIAANIPYRIYGGVRFYERKEIKDVLAALRLAANPRDMLSRERLIKNLPKAAAERLIMELPSLGSERPLLELVSYFLTTTHYFERLTAEYQNAAERIENIKELISFASEFDSLTHFLERASLMQSTDAPAGRTPVGVLSKTTVTLMTIHMAKGLEFDHVFVAGVSEGILPHQMSYDTQEKLEEERRLMYVAMTRARNFLTLSFSKIPSRFLYEIPAELTEFINLSGRSHALPEEDIIYLD